MRQPLSKEARRDAIYHAAIELFEMHGYEHVSISDVIRKSNVARGTFYLHYDSLESILVRWFDEVIEETWSRIQPYLLDLSIPFEACTRQVVHVVFSLYVNNPSMAKVFYCGGGEVFMRRRHEALYGKLGGNLLQALLVRHPDCGREMSWTVAMLISLVSDMSHFAAEYIDENMRDAFEARVADFVLAGLRQHLETKSPQLQDVSSILPDH